MSQHLDAELPQGQPARPHRPVRIPRRDRNRLCPGRQQLSRGTHRAAGLPPEARYEIKIHIDGSAFEDLAHRVTFGPPDQAGEQAVALYLLTGPDACDDDAIGQLLAEGRTNTPASGPDGLRMWAGRAADLFYVDLRSASVADVDKSI